MHKTRVAEEGAVSPPSWRTRTAARKALAMAAEELGLTNSWGTPLLKIEWCEAGEIPGAGQVRGFSPKTLLIRYDLDREETIRTVLHEALHAAQFIAGRAPSVKGVSTPGQEKAFERAAERFENEMVREYRRRHHDTSWST